MTKNNNTIPPISKFWYSVKVIAGLLLLALVLSVIAGMFVGNDFENLEGNVAVIEIKGPIMSESSSGFFAEQVASADEITRLIEKANEDARIKAVIFEINSPGGSAVASDEIAAEIKKLNKTSVAWIREIGTSGAYWIASSTDHIVANRMSITGSIGVISSYLGFSGILEDHNVTYNRLVSGKYKDMGSPFKPLTEEERRIFQGSIDQIHGYFVDEVAANRNLDRRDVEKIATGAFYIGVNAKDLGLVDELGSKDEVLAYVASQIGEDPDLVLFSPYRGFWGSFSTAMNEKFFFMGKGIGSSFELEEGVQITT